MVLLLHTNLTNLFTLFFSASVNQNTILTLRKASLFVNSRYSSNRQWSNSIVYFGLWFNITSVIWTIYYCYSYIFIFSHLYWLGALFVLIGALRFSNFVSLQQGFSYLTGITFKY